MPYNFREKYVANISFIAELIQHRDGGAPAGVLKIDGIDNVGRNAHCVGDDEYPLCYSLPCWSACNGKRKQHHKGIKTVGVEDG